MDQMHLLKQIGVLIEHQDSEIYRELIKILNKGHCYAFAIVMAAMQHIGYGPWWQELLMAVGYWDGDPAKLQNIVCLSQGTPLRLHAIFFLVANYIVGTQNSYKSNFRVQEVNQFNFLEPDKKYFAITPAQGKPKHVLARYAFAGNFTQELLSRLLTPEMLDKKICTVGNMNHRVALYYKDNTYIVYDPNYSHDSILNMQKICHTKAELIYELFLILGSSINFDIAVIGDDDEKQAFLRGNNAVLPFSQFESSLSKADMVQLLSEAGLATILTYTPALFDSFITKLQSVAKQVFYSALLNINVSGQTGLLALLVSRPTRFEDFFSILKEKASFSDEFLQTLPLLESDGRTNFQSLTMINYALVEPLLWYVTVSPQAPALIIQALRARDEEGKTGFLYVLNHSPRMLDVLLKTVSTSSLWPECLVECLSDRIENDGIVLHALLDNFPDYCLPILKRLLSVNNDLDRIMFLFLMPDKKNSICFEKIKEQYPQIIAEVSELLSYTKLIEHRLFSAVKAVLENAANADAQYSCLVNLLTRNRAVILDIINFLPNNFSKRKDMAVEVIRCMIDRAKTVAEIDILLAAVSQDEKMYFLTRPLHVNRFFKAQNFSMTFSYEWQVLENYAQVKIQHLSGIQQTLSVRNICSH